MNEDGYEEKSNGKLNKTQQPKQSAFLAAYAQCGNLSKAAESAGCDRTSHYWWMKNDPDYPAKFDEAHQKSCDAIDAEIRRRAIDGVDRPIFYRGEEVASVKEYSDNLLMFMAKGAMPGKYRENINLSGGLQNKNEHTWTPPEEDYAAAAADLNRFRANKAVDGNGNGHV